MIRKGSLPIETELGTFYAGINQVDEISGPSYYAETATGSCAINGVLYEGTVYFDKPSTNAEYCMTSQHMRRWVDSKWVSVTDSAHRKLQAALLPGIKKLSQDKDAILRRRLAAAKGDFEFAVADAERAITHANNLAAQVRELGESCDSVSLVRVRPAREVVSGANQQD